MDLGLRTWIEDPANRDPTAKREVLLLVCNKFHENGIGHSVSRRDLHLKSIAAIGTRWKTSPNPEPRGKELRPLARPWRVRKRRG